MSHSCIVFAHRSYKNLKCLINGSLIEPSGSGQMGNLDGDMRRGRKNLLQKNMRLLWPVWPIPSNQRPYVDHNRHSVFVCFPEHKAKLSYLVRVVEVHI